MAERTLGIILIILGLTLLGGQLLGSIAIPLLFWPVLLIAWGLGKIRKKSYYFGYGLVIVGIILLLDNILPNQLFQDLGKWWPTLLIILGIFIILRTLEPETVHEAKKTSESQKEETQFATSRVSNSHKTSNEARETDNKGFTAKEEKNGGR